MAKGRKTLAYIILVRFQLGLVMDAEAEQVVDLRPYLPLIQQSSSAIYYNRSS